MSFDYEMKADASSALQASKHVESGLESVERKATETGKAIEGAFKASALKDASGRFLATGVSLGSLRDKVNQVKDASEAFNARLRMNAAESERLKNVQTPLAASFSKVAEAINAEKNMLDKIRGPARQHAEDVALLTSMYNRGKVGAAEYLSTLQKLDASAGVKKKDTGGGGGGFGKGDAVDLVRSQGGSAGGLVGDAMEGGLGTLAKGAGIAAVIGMAKQAASAIVELGDQYTELSRRAQKLAGSHSTVTQVLGDNYRASVALHSSLAEMLELSIAVKQGTDSLNLTSTQQLDLTKSIGAAVKLSGKDLSEARELTEKLSFAMAQGTMNAGDFQEMIKKYPDLLGVMQKATGKSRQELFAMAQTGEISGEMMVDAFQRSGQALQEKLGEQIETTGEKMQHLKDRAAIVWGGIAQHVSTAVGKIIDVMGDLIDPYKNLREEQEREARAATFEAEINEKLAAGAEKLIRLKNLQTEMSARGIDAGPIIDPASLQGADKLRMVMAELGVSMPQAFVQARSKLTLYETKMQELTNARHGERQAEDIRRVWKGLNDVNEILDGQRKKWIDASDAVLEFQRAAKNLAGLRQLLAERGSLAVPGSFVDLNTPQPAPGVPKFVDANAGGAKTVDERFVERGLKDKANDLDAAAGKYSQTSADVIKETRAWKDGLADLNKDLKNHVITFKQWEMGIAKLGIDMGFTYEFLKKLNEPFKTFDLTIGALNALFAVGAINANQYNEELAKIQTTINRNPQELKGSVGPVTIGTGKKAITLAKGMDEQQGSAADAGFGSANLIKLNDALTKQRDLIQQLNHPLKDYKDSVTGSAEAWQKLGSVLEEGWSDKITPQLTLGNAHAQMELNEQMERQAVITTRLLAPARAYKDEIADVEALLKKNAITQGESTTAVINASNAYRAAMAGLQQPQEVYKTALDEINKLLQKNVISQAQATVQALAARDAFRQATDEVRKLESSLGERAFEGARRGLEQVWKQINDIEGLISQKMLNSFNSLENATVDWINGMDVSWKKVAQGIMRDLTQIALRILLIRTINLFSGGSFASLVAGSGGAHASGGSYVAGGSGGPDSQNVMFRLTPGERVDFTPRGEQRASGGGDVVIHNHYDKRGLMAVNRTREGKRQILNAFTEQRGAVRAVMK